MPDYSTLLKPSSALFTPVPIAPAAPAAPAPPQFTKVGTPTPATPVMAPPPSGLVQTAQPKPGVIETPQETAGRRAAELPPDQRVGAAWNDAAKLQAEIAQWARGALSGIPEAERAHIAESIALTAYGMYGSRVAAGEEGARVREDVWAWARAQVAAAAAKQGVPVTPPGQGLDTSRAGPNPVGTANIQDAQAVYTESIQKGRQLYEDLLKTQPQPPPTSIPRPITYQDLAAAELGRQSPIQVRDQGAVRVAGADYRNLLNAGDVNIPVRNLTPEQAGAVRTIDPNLQRSVTVEGADTRALEEQAAGRGAVAEESEALARLQLQRARQQRQGFIAQARGSERRGLTRAMITGAGEEDLALIDQLTAQKAARMTEAQNKLVELDAARKTLQANLEQARAAGDQKAINDIGTRIMELDAQREATNAQLRQQSQEFTESQRVDVGKFSAAQRLAAVSKIAELDQQTRIAQANLDQAKARGDADAANAASMKLADLQFQREKANAELLQDASKFNISNSIDIQKWDIDTALKAQGQEYDQWLQTGDMRIKATESLQKAAQGLLNEDQRQRLLTHAQTQLDLEERKFQAALDEAERKRADESRRFWTTFITSLMATAVGIGQKAATGGAAAHGGAVTSPRLVEVGEAGDHELIIPIKGKLSERLARALSLEAEPFEPAGPKGEIDTEEDLFRALEASLKTLKVDKPSNDNDDEIYQAMAGGLIRGRKRRALGTY